mmetsp:Transcript_17252/g.29731  ORF Transcript_17252/g.29731 Transcript_17252/m.29731 type:complete len:132 (+) Transcript_17252:92-487(+)|eukprot:CAMPEP_0183702198 /NCGR_PEP_ID=MMETSP0737-20130205/380_1 /TAXON_ID=385413 /ORGANISM="Thalassiosira miniscula, Strain CCMP1093" /LENGTH=131 /DNA_ID=CAMNT_0025928765 /DNA_START=166 /DNA_END=561 /DNA_ORIENTATION=+
MPILTVHLDRIENLADKDMIGKSDPYVKFELEQDNTFKDKNYGEMISTTKQDDLNPTYDETFNFNIPELKNMVLTVKVMDKDVGKDGKLGKCKIKLDKLGLDPTPHEYKGKVDNNLFSKDAFVYLNLSYHN